MKLVIALVILALLMGSIYPKPNYSVPMLFETLLEALFSKEAIEKVIKTNN